MKYELPDKLNELETVLGHRLPGTQVVERQRLFDKREELEGVLKYG